MKPFDKPMFVSRPWLPPIERYSEGLQEIWDNQWLSNNGPVVQRFERQLRDALGAPGLSVFANGSLALQLGLTALRLEGEVITTPFTYIATANAIAWNNLEPVFADIEPRWFNIDPARIEALITPRTSAIVAVHTFGVPCDVHALQSIAEKHGLALVYDAAHAFGVTVDEHPVAQFGDMSMFSFHATKALHCVEGGALAFRDASLKPTIDELANHGFNDDHASGLLGSNAKMNELQALMGEMLLGELPRLVAQKRACADTYDRLLGPLQGIGPTEPVISGVEPNRAYYPVRVDAARFGMGAEALQERLEAFQVFSKRYFYPLVTEYRYFRHCAGADELPRATEVADSILVLPLYAGLSLDEVAKICEIIAHIGGQRLSV